MQILVLGGTKFVGRHLVEAALAHGHEVTLFNRGKQNPSLFGDLENLVGDRSSDLKSLFSGSWDVVFDFSGFRPSEVRATAELLAPRVGRYIFVSSISAYDFATIGQESDTKSGINESASIFQEASAEGYGQLKATCERDVAEVYAGRAMIVRPGLIVGPYDSTFRFNYWLDRIRLGGYILAPGRPGRYVQIIDARDLADFMLKLAENSTENSGEGEPAQIYNAAGSLHKMTMEHLLNGVADGIPGDSAPCRFVWASDKQLSDNSIEEWTELPLWIKEDGDSKLFYEIDSTKAENAGLICRSVSQTVADIFRLDPEFANGRNGSNATSQINPVMGESLEAAVLEALQT